LTLIAAPAGAGKTTAVVALHADYSDLPLAWAALDEGDDDPQVFILCNYSLQLYKGRLGNTAVTSNKFWKPGDQSARLQWCARN
jgi:ATP/maltotriose-dependent transcriptional regulator MalT